jgi:CheY-like chemotaxis protein
MTSFSGEGKHIGNNIPLSQGKLEQEQQIQEEKISPNVKRILVVDDDPDITLTFKRGLEDENGKSSKIFFKVDSCNNPFQALTEFKPDYYDLLLIDINMPVMDGIELSNKILDLDVNVKICLVTAGEANVEALRELYSMRSIGCFIKKPVTIEYLVRRIKAELE